MRRAILLLSILFLPLPAFAALEISKVMYDLEGPDKGREWVEVTNTGPSAVRLEGMRFFEGGVNHKLTLVSGSWLLAPSTTAVIADNAAVYQDEHPEYTGTLIDSAFSLSNSGESLALKRGNTTLASTTYSAAKKETKKVSQNSQKKYASTSVAVGASARETPLSSLLPWAPALLGVVLIGIVGVVLVSGQGSRETKLSADEFEIIEN